MSRYLNEGAVWSAVKRIPHITMQTRQAILEALRKVPTADVKEVKHGQWIEDKKDSSSRCSICGWYTDYDYDYVTNNGLGNEDFLFCGHCGARMDGGNEE